MIHTLFPPQVSTVEHRPEDWEGGLLPEEAQLIQGAVRGRVREFTAGRVCARRALDQLGITGWPVLVGAGRAPVWPAGIAGSISHCDDWCGAAVARLEDIAGVGLDVESAQPLAQHLVRRVCTSAELEALELAPEAWAGVDPYKVTFSAKESVYKVHFPLTQEVLEFTDVALVFDIEAGTFEAKRVGAGVALAGGLSLQGRFAHDGTRVFTGAWGTR